MASIDDPDVPEGCESFAPAITQFDECNPVHVFGPFTRLLVGQVGLTADPSTTAGLAAATTEITTRLALPDTDPTALRLLSPLRGNMPAATANTRNIDGIDYPVPATRNLPFTISQMNDKNYEFARTTQVGRKGRYWPLNDSYMYGGKDGIDGSLTLFNIVPEAEDGLHQASGNLSYTSKFDPKRTAAPL
jgi:hypothetical protein